MVHKEYRNLIAIIPDPSLHRKRVCAKISCIWSEKGKRRRKVSGPCTYKTW